MTYRAGIIPAIEYACICQYHRPSVIVNHTALGRCATNRAVTLVCRLDLLCLVKLAVLVARFHELLVGAVGEHLPLVDEEDGIGVGSVYEA